MDLGSDVLNRENAGNKLRLAEWLNFRQNMEIFNICKDPKGDVYIRDCKAFLATIFFHFSALSANFLVLWGKWVLL